MSVGCNAIGSVFVAAFRGGAVLVKTRSYGSVLLLLRCI